MKRFLLVLTVVLFCFGCKSDAEENLKQILKEYEPATQVFKIDADSLIQIKGERGTVLNIDPSVFVHQDGNEVTGEIEIHLIELTTTEDLLRANAQTISDEKWLISGGAYYIEAFSENMVLKLVDGKTIEVSFPKIASEEMQLFDGSRDIQGNINWTASNQVLKNRKYPVVIQEDSLFTVYDQNYAIEMPVDSMVSRKLKEKYSINDLQKKHQEIDSLIVKNDTLFAYIFSKYVLMSKMFTDSLLRPDVASELIMRKKITRQDIFAWELYNTISISKLGWINVDRFYLGIENRVNFEIEPDIEMDYAQLYAADSENNTLLNLYVDAKGVISFDAPIGKRFTIIAFGIKGEQTYGYKKSVLIEKDTKHQIKYRKADKKKMEAYFRLD